VSPASVSAIIAERVIMGEARWMNIGFIGLGRMGGAMARNLQDSGHTLYVNDIRREACDGIVSAGGTFGPTPADVARQSEAVFISVPGPDQVDAALDGDDGLLAGLSDGMLVIDATTIGPDQSRVNARRCAERGADYIDAPVSGGQHGAQSRDLAAMVGADAASFERAKPLLECIAKNITHVGPIGTGSSIKLLNQLIFVSYQLVFAEGLAIGEDLGLDLETMLQVWGASAAGHPEITMKYVAKNALLFFDLAEQARGDLGYTTPLFEAASESLRRAVADGLAGEDMIRARARYRKHQS
jgi:3-hydroxyisobutyrate dehydrogenase-like beta-hydroxyacid dehydrogenase